MRSVCAHTWSLAAVTAAALLLPASAAGAAIGAPGAAGVEAVSRAPVASAAAGAVAAATATAAVPAAFLAVTNPTLRLGSKGAAVTRLQQRLTDLHYDVAGVDGQFGSKTLHAVYAFQKVQGISVDGVVGPVTWSRLADPRIPVPRHTRSTAAVEIDLGLRVVYLTKDGAVTKIVDASPGKPSTPTVTGSFTIYKRIDGWRQSDLGLLWRPNYFHSGYALHGSTSVPTYAASHGCVRVTISAMNRLWPKLSIGEHLYVYG